MDRDVFINNFKEAFGDTTELPIMFWYSDEEVIQTEKINGCFFKTINAVREVEVISLNADVMGCGGGTSDTGFTAIPVQFPNFVSLYES